MGVVVAALRRLLLGVSAPAWVTLASCMAAGATVYALVLWWRYREVLRGLRELWRAARGRSAPAMADAPSMETV
jgi:hypothetical protein